MISGLVLAAEAGRQLGSAPAEVVLGGQRLIDRSVFTLRAGGCDDVVAVVPSLAVSADGAKVIVNPDADSDVQSSLRLGLSRLHPDTEAVLITRVDLPDIAATEVKAAIGWYRNGASLIITRRGGERSHPVLVARRWLRSFAEAAKNEDTARLFFAQNYEHIDFLDYPQTIPVIDSPEALAAAENRLSQ